MNEDHMKFIVENVKTMSYSEMAKALGVSNHQVNKYLMTIREECSKPIVDESVSINFIIECFDEALDLKTCWKVFRSSIYTLYTLTTSCDLSSIIKDTGTTITIEMRQYDNAKIIVRDTSKKEVVKTRIMKTIKTLTTRKSEYDYLLDK